MQNLLLLHGAIGAASQFEDLSSQLWKDFNVHVLNFSGHGGASMPDDFSIMRFGEDVVRYLDEKQINTIDIFGYSMGGYVALYLAKNYSDRVERVFTLATKFDWTSEIAGKEIKMLNPEKIEEKLPQFAQQLKERHSPNDWKKVMHLTADMMLDLGEHNAVTVADLKEIQHQVLVSIGDSDKMVTLEETVKAYHHLPNAQLLVMPMTQHPIEKVPVDRLQYEIDRFFLN